MVAYVGTVTLKIRTSEEPHFRQITGRLSLPWPARRRPPLQADGQQGGEAGVPVAGVASFRPFLVWTSLAIVRRGRTNLPSR